MKNLRVVFMGSPEFAVATLDALLRNGVRVVGVVTSPDKPAGRGRKIKWSAVKKFAEDRKLPVFQPVYLKDPEFINILKKLNADLFIVVAFRMLPGEVWKMPRLGSINLHASLLPDYRGAAPINHVIINGETKTGVTTFFIDDKIDTGNILLREEVQISPDENAGELHDKLMKQGAILVIKTLTDLTENKIQTIPQTKLIDPQGEALNPAPKIHPEDCIINWNNDAVKIHNQIRGLAPYPGAQSAFRGDSATFSFKIYGSIPKIVQHSFSPGTISSDGKQYIRVYCKDGFLAVTNLQLEGKNRMNVAEFLRGFRITNFSIPVNQPV